MEITFFTVLGPCLSELNFQIFHPVTLLILPDSIPLPDNFRCAYRQKVTVLSAWGTWL